MKRLFAMISPRWQRPLRFAAWGMFIVFVSVNLPFLFDLMSRGIAWIMGLFPHADDLWKECPWCF